MKVAIYVRTSPGDNDGSAQLHELQRRCEAEGWTESHVFIESDTSGASLTRPVWDEVMALARRGELDVLLATELSRVSRRGAGAVALALEELERLKVRVVITRLGLDLATSMGRFAAVLFAEFARLEREVIGERVRAGMRRAKEKGTRSGEPIGRKERSVDLAQLERAADLVRRGRRWKDAASAVQVPETTLRRKMTEAGLLDRAYGRGQWARR